MQITIEMIESKEFKIKPRGYDQLEVDEFLDAICDEMAAQQDQIQALQQQLMSAQAKRPAPAPAPAVTPDATGALQEILEMAQKVKAETIAAAEKQAEEIIAQAQAQADSQLKNLQNDRDSLTRQVTELKAAAAEYRTRFEALLQAQQEAIEKAADLF